MPPGQASFSSRIKWQKVTWYSKLSTIILFIGVISALSFYIGTQYESTRQGLTMPVQVSEITHKSAQLPLQNLNSTTTPLPNAKGNSVGINGLQLIAGTNIQGCASFYTDSKAVYVKGTDSEGGSHFSPELEVLRGADPSSFKVLTQSDGFGEYDCSYSEDSAHVFYGNQVIVGADPRSFQGMGMTDIAHDSASVYFGTTTVGTLDGNVAKILAPSPPDGPFYIKDARQVYYFFMGFGLDGSGPSGYFKVLGADPFTFSLVSNSKGIDARDKNHNYFEGRVVN